MPRNPQTPLRVFIGCPGDMAPERAEILKLRDQLDHLDLPVRFLIWKNATPGAGDAQKVIFDNYPVETWDIFIGLLWTRFGVPSGIADPISGETLTGTESEFVTAYEAWNATGGTRPQIFLYRCTRDVPVSLLDIDQLSGVQKFFKQTETAGARPALAQDFKTAEELCRMVVPHIKKAAERLRATAKKPAISAGKAASAAKKAPNWPAVEEAYRRHLIDSHRIVKFHTAEARAPVEVELEKVFIKLMAEENEFARLRSYGVLVGDPNEPYNEGDLAGWQRLSAAQKRDAINSLDEHERIILQLRGYFLKGGPLSLHSESSRSPTSLPALLRDQNHLALSGSPGSGKSTLLQYLVLTFASRQQQARLQLDEERLPVLVRLRQFHRWIEQQRHDKKFHELKPAHFHQFLEWSWQQEIVGQAPRLPSPPSAGGAPALQCPPHHLGAPELPRGFFQRILSQPNALILLDGLDEVADPAQRREIAALVARALDDWRDARVILTSRPRAWESEGHAALGSRVGEARICDLDDAQIEEFVRHWYLAATIAMRGDTPSARGHAESRAVDLINAVEPDRIRKLAATPLMLSILAMVHSRGVGLPQERSQLYHECIEFMLGYWDEIQGLVHDPELHEVAARDRQTKRQLLEPVALWMHRLGSEQIEPLHDDLVREFAKGFQSVLNEPKPAAERHARAFLRLIVERGGLMQESEAGQFRFVHLTFQEYLAASAIAHGEAPFEHVKAHLHDPWWREVILLASGELSRQRSYRVRDDTTAWLAGILNAGSRWEVLLRRDLQLALYCCAEMMETGVDPAMTRDLVARIVQMAATASGDYRLSAPYIALAAGPSSHVTRALADALATAVASEDGMDFPWFEELAFALEPEAITEGLLNACRELINARGESASAIAGYLMWRADTLTDPEAAASKFREVAGAFQYAAARLPLERLLQRTRDPVRRTILDWLRAEWEHEPGFYGTRPVDLLAWHGEEADRAFAISELCRVARESPPHEASYAIAELGALGATGHRAAVADTLQFCIEHGEGEARSEAIRALLRTLGASASDEELGWLDAILNGAEPDAARAAACGILQHGPSRFHDAAGKRLRELFAAATGADCFDVAYAWLKADPDAPRQDIAATAVTHLAAAREKIPWQFAAMVKALGAAVWSQPALIQTLSDLARATASVSGHELARLMKVATLAPAESDLASSTVALIIAEVDRAASTVAAGAAPKFKSALHPQVLEGLGRFAAWLDTQRIFQAEVKRRR